MNTTLPPQCKPFNTATLLAGKTMACLFNKRLLTFFLLTGLFAARTFGQAPAISYSNPQPYTVGTAITPLTPTSSGISAQAYSPVLAPVASGFSNPRGIAVDAAGNVYEVDLNGTKVTKIPAGGGAPVTFASGLSGLAGVAVDAAGNIYLTITGTSGVVSKIPAGGGTPVTISSGFSGLAGIAVDAAANVYVAEQSTNTVKKIPVGGGAAVTIGTGFSSPSGVAVDAAGNVYVADLNHAAVKKIPVGGGAPVTIGSGFSEPVGVAVDAAGDVYVDNFLDVREILASGGTPVIIASNTFNSSFTIAVDAAGNVLVGDGGSSGRVRAIVPIGGYYTGPFLPAGLLINSNTGVISGTPTAASAAANYTVTAYSGAGITVYNSNAVSTATVVNIGVAPAPPTTQATGLAFIAITKIAAAASWTNGNGTSRAVFMAAASGGSPLPVNLTAYSANAAFGSGSQIGTSGWYCVYDGAGSTVNITGLTAGVTYQAMVIEYNKTGSTVAYLTTPGTGNPAGLTTLPTFTYTSPQIYTVGTAITPLTPNNSGTVAQAYNAAQVTIASGFNSPGSIAADAAGNVYEVDNGSSTVTKIPAGGGARVTFASGFNSLAGVAVDAAGNVYVTDSGNGTIKEIPAGGGVPVTIGPGFSKPFGIAVDVTGNIYVADTGTGRITKIPVGGGSPVTIGSGFAAPDGLAVDAAGNVYVADHLHNTPVNSITKIPAGGGAPVTIGSGFTSPAGVAVDAAGNVYVADITGIVAEIPAGNGTPVNLGSAFSAPFGIAIDGAGNLYVTDFTANTVSKILPAGGYYTSSFLPAGLIINSNTGVISGTPAAVSAAANYAVTAYYGAGVSITAIANIGVAPGPPTIPPASVAFTGTTTTATTASWTNGNGTARAVFVAAASSGSPAPANLTPYNASTVFGSGGQAGTSGWFCVYNGTGSTVNVTGLTSGTTYQAMVVEYNSTGNAIAYLTTPGTGNPAGVTTLPAISYSTPNGYYTGTAITPLTPTGNGIAAQAYNPVPVTIGSGFNNPRGIAVDAAGNIYEVDNGGATIKEIPAGGGAPVTFASGLTSAVGLAIDAAGNLYVADAGNNAIKKIPAGGGAPVAIGPGFTKPSAVAVDIAGNVYVTITHGASVTKIPADGSAPVTLGSGFINPDGVAVDAAGNVYVVDRGNFSNSTLTKIPAGGGALVTIVPANIGVLNCVVVDAAGNVYVAGIGDSSFLTEFPAGNGAPVTIASGFLIILAVAVDAAGNVYVGDINSSIITKILPVGGYYTNAFLPAGLFINSNTGVISGTPTAASAAANYTVTAYNGSGLSASATVNITVAGIPTTQTTNVSFTGTTTASTTASWTNGNGASRAVFMAAASGGSPAPANLTAYNANAAFGSGDQIGSTGWYCVYNGTGSTVTVTGFTGGATYQAMVVEYNGTGSTVAYLTTPATGNPAGVTILLPPPAISYSGPQGYFAGTAITLTPTSSGIPAQVYNPVPVTIGSGFSNPRGIAVDAAGNIYEVDNGGTTIKKIPAGGGAPVTFASGLTSAVGLAIDAAGNLYVADSGNNAIKKIPAGGGTPVAIGPGFTKPSAVAVDVAGNVYVTVTNGASITKIPAGGGATVTLGSGFINPDGVAVDAAGNVYVVDKGNSANSTLKKIPAGGGAPITLFPPNVGALNCVAVDAAGNVYVAGIYDSSFVTEFPAGNGAPVTIASGFLIVLAVAVDAAGNVYVGDFGNSAITKILPAGGYYTGPFLPAGLFINSNTGVISGTPTAASAAANYTVTAYNSAGISASATVNIAVVGIPTTQTTNLSFTGTTTTSTTASWTNGNGTSRAVFMAAASSGSPAPANLTAYNANAVFGSGDQIGSTGWYCVYNGAGSTVNVTGLTPATTYQAMVAEYNGTGSNAFYLTTPGTGNPAGVTTLSPTTVTAITAAATGPTRATTLDYTVTFASALTTVPSTGDFAIKGSATGTINSVTGSGTTYDVNVTNVSGDGNLELDMISGSDASPTISNLPFKGGAYTIDNTAPTAFTLTYASNHAGNSQIAASGDVVSLDFTASEAIQNPTLTIAGHSITATNVGGNEWLGTYTTTGSDTEGRIPFTLSFNDLAGNPQPGAPYSDIAAGDDIQFVTSVATLANLSFTPGKLTAREAFSPAVFNYTLTVGSVPNIIVTAVPTDPNATVTVNGGDPALPQTLIIGDNTETIVVTATDGSTRLTYTVVVTRPASVNDNVSTLALSRVKLSATFDAGTTSYTAAVVNSFTSTTLTFRTSQTSSTAQIGIAGTLAGSTSPGALTPATSGVASPPLQLAIGDNFISVVVTAQDGKTTQTYTVDVVRAAPPLPAITTLSGLAITNGVLSPAFKITAITYKDAVAFSVPASTVVATTTDPLATVMITGNTSGTAGQATSTVALNVGLNPVIITVTAQNGATKIYTINVTRAPSSNANITAVKLSSGKLSPAFKQTVLSGYTVTVASTLAAIDLTATTGDANATATITAETPGPAGPTFTPLGTLTSGSPFNVALNPGDNIFFITCTAQDGSTTKQYSMTIVRGVEGANSLYQPVSVVNPANSPLPIAIGMADNINVHQGVSPNGDGINDVLVIDGIASYPDNKLSIMSRDGDLVFETTGYDNSAKAFDGHSSKNGKMQQPGTYFYSLDYKVGEVTKHKTGFIILKY